MKADVSRFIIGAVVLALGVALLLDALFIVNTSGILADWWPSLIVLAGAVMLISDAKNYVWSLVIMTLGVFIQLRVLGYYASISLWQLFWPLVLIAFGVSIVMKRPVVPLRKNEASSDDIVAILGGTDQKNVSNDYAGGRATAILGGAKLDLRNATIKKAATVEVLAILGGVELVVPRGVVVKNQTNALLGGVENKTDQEAGKNAPVLTVVGDVILGGVEIKN